ENGNGLRGVPWGRENLQPDLAAGERFSMGKWRKGELGLGLSPQANGRAKPIPQFNMAGEEISVKMGQKDILDVKNLLCCVLQILVNITLWINHDRRTRSCIGDEIGGMRETAKVILLQHHGVFLF